MSDGVKRYDVVIAISLLSFVFIAPCLYVGWLWWRDMSSCEAAIEKQLKAPATYRRVSSESEGNGLYWVTYDAQNSFGVPLRSRGLCTIDRGTGVATFADVGG